MRLGQHRGIWFALLIALFPVVAAQAESIGFEPFDYPTGFATGNGGQGFNGPWSATLNVQPGSLAYTDGASNVLATSGNHFQTPGNSAGVFRTIDTASLPPALLSGGRLGADGTSMYIRMLTNLASGSSGGYGGLSLFDGATERFFMGDPGFATFLNWGVDLHGATAPRVFESPISVDSQTRLLVARIDFGAASETVRLYVDPPLSGEPATASVGPVTMANFNFDRIRLESGLGTGGQGGQHRFDEIGLATTYAEVIPEPAAAVLLLVGLSMAAIVATRVRRNRVRAVVRS
jgi:hypothetical protein